MSSQSPRRPASPVPVNTESIWLAMVTPMDRIAARSGMSASSDPACLQARPEIHVVVVRHHLVARQRLEAIAVREREHLIDRRGRAIGAHVPIDRHALNRTGRRAVEREVLLVLLRLLAFGLADAERERLRAVLAIPVVAKIRLDLARPEERMRRRKDGDRPGARFRDDGAIGGLEDHRAVVDRAAEMIFLPGPRGVAPGQTRVRLNRHAGQPRVVLVGDR